MRLGRFFARRECRRLPHYAIRRRHETYLAEWLEQHGRTGRENSTRPACHEEVRHGGEPKDCVHGGYPAARLQMRIDDHQVGAMPRGSSNGLQLRRGGGADLVPECRQDFSKQRADLCIVLDQDNAETCRASLLSRQVCPFNQESISLSRAKSPQVSLGSPFARDTSCADRPSRVASAPFSTQSTSSKGRDGTMSYRSDTRCRNALVVSETTHDPMLPRTQSWLPALSVPSRQQGAMVVEPASTAPEDRHVSAAICASPAAAPDPWPRAQAAQASRRRHRGVSRRIGGSNPTDTGMAAG